jgi:hypothetical protein
VIGLTFPLYELLNANLCLTDLRHENALQLELRMHSIMH